MADVGARRCEPTSAVAGHHNTQRRAHHRHKRLIQPQTNPRNGPLLGGGGRVPAYRNRFEPPGPCIKAAMHPGCGPMAPLAAAPAGTRPRANTSTSAPPRKRPAQAEPSRPWPAVPGPTHRLGGLCPHAQRPCRQQALLCCALPRNLEGRSRQHSLAQHFANRKRPPRIAMWPQADVHLEGLTAA